jgi:hypothetical protein
MSTMAGGGDPRRWWLSRIYVVTILVATVSAVLAPLTVASAGGSAERVSGIVATAAIVGAIVAVVGVSRRVRAVRYRLRPGAVSISASAATFGGIGWTFLVVTGLHAYRESDEEFWTRLPAGLATCLPVLIVAACALTVSRFVQRDDARRTAALRHAREAVSAS